MLQCQWVHGKDVAIMAVAGMEAKRCLKKRHCFKAQRYRPALRSRNVRLHFSQLVPARQTSALSPFVTEVHCFMKDECWTAEAIKYLTILKRSLATLPSNWIQRHCHHTTKSTHTTKTYPIPCTIHMPPTWCTQQRRHR